MASGDIESRLNNLAKQRAQVEARIKQSSAILSAIDEKMADFKRRQQERLTLDERVGTEVVKAVASEEGKGHAS